MICPNCGSDHVVVQQQVITKNKLRLGAALIISPLALAAPKTKTKYQTVAVCQNCGNTFNPALAAYTKAPKKKVGKPSASVAATSKSIADELEKYSLLLERGVISQEEFDILKKGLLENMNSSIECDDSVYDEDTYSEPVRSSYGAASGSELSANETSATPANSDDIADLKFKPPVRKGFRVAFWVCLGFAWLYGLLAATTDPSMFMLCTFFVGLAVFFLFHSMTSKDQTRFSVFGYVCPLSKKAVSWIIAVVFIILVSILANTMAPSASTADTSGSDVSDSSISAFVSDADTSGSDAA